MRWLAPMVVRRFPETANCDVAVSAMRLIAISYWAISRVPRDWRRRSLKVTMAGRPDWLRMQQYIELPFIAYLDQIFHFPEQYAKTHSSFQLRAFGSNAWLIADDEPDCLSGMYLSISNNRGL
jgi:hypothetical protein